LKLHNFSDWNKRTIQLSECDTDKLTFNEGIRKD